MSVAERSGISADNTSPGTGRSCGPVTLWASSAQKQTELYTFSQCHTKADSPWVRLSSHSEVPLKMGGFWTWASVGEGNVPTKFKKRKFCTWIHLPFFPLKGVVPVSIHGSTCLIRKKYFFEILLEHCPQHRKWKYHWWLASKPVPFSTANVS